MSEKIQERLELMVSSFNDLKGKGIFNEEEVKTILKKRRQFEFQCQSKPTKKVDFLNYLTFELNLESLRKKRTSRVASGNKPTLGDFSIQRHIYNLFERALFKFKGDVNLWIQYINFASQQKAKAIVKKALVRSLRLLPTSVVLWSLAANYEFEHNLNMDAARALFQRGLRLNSNSQSLYLEYFKLEARYLNKLKLRKQVLELDQASTGGGGLALELHGLEGEDGGDILDEQVLQGLQQSDPLLQGDVLKFIFNYASQTFPDDTRFQIQFLQLYREFGLEDGVEFVLGSLKARYPKDLDVLNTVLRMQLPQPEEEGYLKGLKCCILEFEQRIDKQNLIGLIEHFVQFLLDRMDGAEEPNLKEYLKLKLKQTFFKYFTQFELEPTQLTSTFYLQFSKFLKRELEDPATALKVVQVALVAYPSIPELYTLNYFLLDEEEEQKALLHKGLKHLATNHIFDLNLWELYLDLLVETDDDDEEEQEQEKEEEEEKEPIDYDQMFHFLTSCLHLLQTSSVSLNESEKESRDQIKAQILIKCLDLTYQTQPIHQLRQLELQLTKFTTLVPPFYQKWIALELKNYSKHQKLIQTKSKRIKLGNQGLNTFQHIFDKEKGTLADTTFQRIQTIYQKMCNQFNTPHLYLEYLQFLHQFGSTTQLSKLQLHLQGILDPSDYVWVCDQVKLLFTEEV